eukprot:TRINITY_DN17567_c0_g1_i1.p1 TRINITY_DN17567_c0_g1~~TRINITY_DN17567_c0_g1_i1.p1  ORF type:complete len:213 (+),score=34.63 TRINITY_DN17567_c0_g1_i1:105-743(+)
MAIMDEDELQDLYQWVDSIPLSRPKKNIARDFSDGMLVAEVIKHFFPKLVDLHNYPAAHSTSQKLYNWRTLSTKVFKKLNFEVDDAVARDIATCEPGAIERFLRALQTKVQQIQQKKIQRQQAAHQSDPGMLTGAYPAPDSRRPVHHPRADVGFSNETVETRIIQEKNETISELRETIEILELKIKKIEQLLQLKDSKIQSQAAKLQQHGIK